MQPLPWKKLPPLFQQPLSQSWGWTPPLAECHKRLFKVINDDLPGFGRTVEIVRNKSSKAASYRIKFTHIDSFKFHVRQIIGEYEIHVLKENKTAKEKVKVVCTDEKPIKIDYHIRKGILMIIWTYNLFNWYGRLYRF